MMMHRFASCSFLAVITLALGGCSTVEDVIAYGKGPFDHGPLPRSETALEGLHESSWGNSGKWGARGNRGAGADTWLGGPAPVDADAAERSSQPDDQRGPDGPTPR